MNKITKRFTQLIHGKQKGGAGTLLICVIGLVLILAVVPGFISGIYSINLDKALEIVSNNGYILADPGGLTAGRVVLSTGANTLADDGGLTYNSATDTLASGSISAPTGRSATFVVAADNTPAIVKAQADYVWDGTGDATAEVIQPAIDALPISGGYSYGSIELVGKFTILSTIIVKGNVTIFGDTRPYIGQDMGTVIYNANAAAATAIRFHSGATLEATPVIKNIEIRGNAASGIGVHFDQVSNFTMDNCVSNSNGGDGVRVTACYGGDIVKSRIINNTGRGVAFVGATGDTTGTPCVIQKLTSDWFYDNHTTADIYEGICHGLSITDCLRKGTTGPQIPFVYVGNTGDNRLWMDNNDIGGLSPGKNYVVVNDAENAIITNNRFAGGGDYAIVLANTNTGVINISNNMFGAATSGAISVLGGTPEVTISSNTIYIDTTTYVNNRGINVDSTIHPVITSNTLIGNNGAGNNIPMLKLVGSSHAVISNNYFFGADQDAIWTETSDHASITGNTIKDSTRWGIVLVSSRDCTVISNIIEGSGVDALQEAPNYNNLYSTKVNDFFMDALAVSATHVRSNEDLSAGVPLTFTIDAQPDVPRTLSGHFDSHAQITAYSITITGTDAKGLTVTDTFTQAASPWDFETVNAYATITSIVMTARTGTGAADTMDIGITDVLGLSNKIYTANAVYKIKKNNADAVVIAGDINTTYDTYDMHTITLGAGDDFTIWYKSPLNVVN